MRVVLVRAGPMRILCVFGAHQYGDAARGESTESFSFVPALRALGHDVQLFDSWDKSAHRDYAELNVALVDRCKRAAPDVVLWVALTVEVWLETLDYLRGVLRVRVIHWAPDDSWKFRQHSRFVARHVDLCVTTYPEFLGQYHCLGVTAVASGWGVPESWRGEVVPAANCAYDVTFVGTAQPARVAMVEALERKGIRVQCFGFGWPAGPISPERIPDIFRLSRISLNFANSSGANQVKARVFEVTGAGGFLLSQTAPGIDRTFDCDREIAVFASIDECEQQVRRYLGAPALRDAVARAAMPGPKGNILMSRVCAGCWKAMPPAAEIQPESRSIFRASLPGHTHPKVLRWIAGVLTALGCGLFGREGDRASPKSVFRTELAHRGKTTFRAARLRLGRMFYAQ
ncbi:MAG: glycosyltransferase [Sulfuritalea sp.]|nr:glycosyltransferase [Sulfuritalea sp.]